jgi:hypothetical protein
MNYNSLGVKVPITFHFVFHDIELLHWTLIIMFANMVPKTFQLVSISGLIRTFDREQYTFCN